MDKKDSILASLTRFLGAAFIAACGYITGKFAIDYKEHALVVDKLDISDLPAMFKEHVEPLWHLCARLVQTALRCSARSAGSLVSGVALFVAFLIAWRAIRISVKGISALKLTALCLVLHLVAAIYIPWFNKQPYLGQGTPNVWHNPTLIMVRPIALLTFILTAQQLQKIKDSGYEKNLSILSGLLCAVLLMAANLAKPSYAQIFYPAIFLLMLGWLISSKGKTWKHCVQFFLMCLPSVVVMIFQFIFTFMKGSEGGEGAGGAGGIIIAPLVAASKYSPSIPISILLVLAFPIFMSLVTIVRRRFGQREILAWLLVLVGLAQKLLLAESGPRMYDGNFGWGYLNALIIIWFVSIRDFAEAFLAERQRPVESMTAAAQVSGVTATVNAVSAAEDAAGSIASAIAAAGSAASVHSKPAEETGTETGEELSAAAGAGSPAEGPAAVWTPGDSAGASEETGISAEFPHAPEMADLTFSAENYTETYGGDVPLRTALPAEETEGSSFGEEPVQPEATVVIPEETLEALEETPAAEVIPQRAVPAAEPATAAGDTQTAEQSVAAGENPGTPKKGGVKDFFIGLVRGIGFTVSSIFLAAHFLSGLYYLFYWLIWLRHTM